MVMRTTIPNLNNKKSLMVVQAYSLSLDVDGTGLVFLVFPA